MHGRVEFASGNVRSLAAILVWFPSLSIYLSIHFYNVSIGYMADSRPLMKAALGWLSGRVCFGHRSSHANFTVRFPSLSIHFYVSIGYTMPSRPLMKTTLWHIGTYEKQPVRDLVEPASRNRWSSATVTVWFPSLSIHFLHCIGCRAGSRGVGGL